MSIVVPAQTPIEDCRVAWIGEAPGQEEIDHKPPKPLVGPSGKIFNALLRTAELDRHDPSFFVGNVFDQKLPSNNVKHWCAPTDEARAGGFNDLPPIGSNGYLRPEYRHHLKRLRDEMSHFKPTVIVPMGNTALWAFLGTEAISQHRGAVIPATRTAPGVKLVPAYHPAFIMQSWKFFHITVGDMIKAVREADRGPEIIYPERRLILQPTLSDVREFTKIAIHSDILSLDIETGWGQITCFGAAYDTENAICIPFVDLRKPNKSYWGSVDKEIEAWHCVRLLCECPVPKLGQFFAGYDAFWMLEKMGIRTINLLEDTRLLHHALYPELPKDLAFMGTSYGSQGAWKTMRSWNKEKRDD